MNSCSDCRYFREVDILRAGEQSVTMGVCKLTQTACYAETMACGCFEDVQSE